MISAMNPIVELGSVFPEYNQSEEIRHEIDSIQGVRISVFQMTQHYWGAVLQREWVSTPGFKVANLQSGVGIDAIPISLALQGKTKYDLAEALRRKPSDSPVEVKNFEIDEASVTSFVGSSIGGRFTLPIEDYQFVDITALPIEDESVDIALLRNPNIEDFLFAEEGRDYIAVFEEADRILEVGGLFWSTHPTFAELSMAQAMFQFRDFGQRYKVHVAEKNTFPVGSVWHQKAENKLLGLLLTDVDAQVFIAEKLRSRDNLED